MTAVILAGGQGTRLRSVAGSVPKALVDLSGKTVLERQLDNFVQAGVERVVLMLGYQAEKVQDRFPSGLYRGIPIDFLVEKTPLGTAGGLRRIRDLVGEDFIFSSGDIVFSIDFERLLGFHFRNRSICTMAVHPNDHPFDSDVVLVDELDGSLVTGIFSKKGPRPPSYRNLVSAGLMVLSREILDLVGDGEPLDFERDVLPKAIETGRVRAYKTTEYVKDMGTPRRLEEVREAISAGRVERRSLSHKQKAVFLDRDGTINEYRGFIARDEDLVLYPEAPEGIAALNRSDFLAIVVTNQPVVARNLCSEGDLRKIHDKMETELGLAGAYLDDIFYCPHHPDRGFPDENTAYKIDCDCRKPKIGLIERACSRYNIDPARSYMVGDSTTDLETARRAGLKSILVLTGESGRDGKFDGEADFMARDVGEAVEVIMGAQDGPDPSSVG